MQEKFTREDLIWEPCNSSIIKQCTVFKAYYWKEENIFKCNLFIMAFLLFLYNKNTGCKIKQPDGPNIIF